MVVLFLRRIHIVGTVVGRTFLRMDFMRSIIMRARIRPLITESGVYYIVQLKEFWFMPWRYYCKEVGYESSERVQANSLGEMVKILRKRFGAELIIQDYVV